MKDYYQILGIPHGATQAEIKARFNFLAQAFHPDKFATPAQQEKAEEEFKEINEANQVLSNPIKRTEYDRGRSEQSSWFSEEERHRKEQAEEKKHRAEYEQHKREQDEAERHRAEHERQEREQAESAKRRAEYEQHQREEVEAERLRTEHERQQREQAEANRRRVKKRKRATVIITKGSSPGW